MYKLLAIIAAIGIASGIVYTSVVPPVVLSGVVVMAFCAFIFAACVLGFMLYADYADSKKKAKEKFDKLIEERHATHLASLKSLEREIDVAKKAEQYVKKIAPVKVDHAIHAKVLHAAGISTASNPPKQYKKPAPPAPLKTSHNQTYYGGEVLREGSVGPDLDLSLVALAIAETYPTLQPSEIIDREPITSGGGDFGGGGASGSWDTPEDTSSPTDTSSSDSSSSSD